MEPTAEEIAKDLIRLSARISAYGDDPITSLERQSLARATAYCVELVRRKYKLVSGYYVPAEQSAKIMYERMHNGLNFH